MKLLDAIRDLGLHDGGATIYAAKPWTEESVAMIAFEPEAGGLPEGAAKLGMSYFLEIFVAREFSEDWKSSLDKHPSAGELCARLIQYAINDA